MEILLILFLTKSFVVSLPFDKRIYPKDEELFEKV